MTLALATKGILSDNAITLASKGILVPVLVIIEPPVPTPSFRQTGGGGSSGKSRVLRRLKKIKVTLLVSGETSTQEIVIDPAFSVKAQLIDILELPQNSVFVRLKKP